jgi:sugar O-acyltransferase (sialic acid O-acetyltransferase NeuD family)
MSAAGVGAGKGEMVVVGGGGHAKVLISLLKKAGYQVVGYTDKIDRGLILDVGYLGDDAVLRDFITGRGQPNAVIGIGKVDASPVRLDRQRGLQAWGFGFPVIRSPEAVVNEDVVVGPGTVLMDRVVVNSGTEIGEASILNTGSTVEHDCRVGDNVHIASGATLAGGVTIGDHCMIGMGCNVIQLVTIVTGCIVGAGATVVRDLSEPGTYVGSPAKRVH